jgi:hypothetical protein
MNSDLRNSVRGALAHRVTRSDYSKPYLDKISVTKHQPPIGRNSWKHLLIQPISVPNLEHTGIQSAFGEKKEPLMKPDGSVNFAMRSTIKKQYTALSREHQRLKKRSENLVDGEDEYEDYDDNRVELQETAESRSGPGPPNFENFLDFVYGPSNVAGTYRRNYETQMRVYNPVEDEKKFDLTRNTGRRGSKKRNCKKQRYIKPVSPQEKERYTTNINYYTDSEKMDEENEETVQLLELYDKSVQSTVDDDSNYVRM